MTKRLIEVTVSDVTLPADFLDEVVDYDWSILVAVVQTCRFWRDRLMSMRHTHTSLSRQLTSLERLDERRFIQTPFNPKHIKFDDGYGRSSTKDAAKFASECISFVMSGREV
jgi:hypothetical protein